MNVHDAPVSSGLGIFVNDKTKSSVGPGPQNRRFFLPAICISVKTSSAWPGYGPMVIVGGMGSLNLGAFCRGTASMIVFA